MDAQPLSISGTTTATAATAAKAGPPADDGPSFHDILSALNPLQYVPVVGTIYRAITGDTIPEGIRVVGSFIFSALTGGPFGMILNAATVVAEKATGIDPEQIGHDVLAWAGIAGDSPSAGSGPAVLEAGTPSATPPTPWTAPQRAAYGDQPSSLSEAPRPDPPALSDAMRLAALDSYRRSLATSVA
ncbi:MAG: hypothetical protein J0H14_22935 [Alphaproteobacteria bacterium]|nr:hypothetical protein [Alphaproteobacteria bacterium]